MSTARKQHPEYSDPGTTVTGEIVALETATETMMDYIGYLSSEVLKEEERSNPNGEKIRALEAQIRVVSSERQSISPEQTNLIAKALYVYAPILKGLRSSGSA